MKRTFICTLLVMLGLTLPLSANRAPDFARPKEAAKPEGPSLQIRTSADMKTATLQIPRSLLLDAAPKPKEKQASLNTIIAGVFLSAAVAFAGIGIARRRGAGSKTLTVIAMAALLAGSGASIAIADLAVPREPRPAPKVVNPAEGVSIPIQIEVVDEGDVAKLTLDEKRILELSLAILKKQNANKKPNAP